MAFETFIAEQFIVSKLNGDATLVGLIANRVYADVASTNAVFPFVVFTDTTYEDIKGNGNQTAMAKITYLIKAVGKTRSYASLKDIAERVETVLNHTKGAVVPLGIVDACESGAIFKQAYSDASGIDYRELGKFYEILVQGV